MPSRRNTPAHFSTTGAAAFAPGVKAAEFEALMDFNSYPQHSSPRCFRPGGCSPKTEPACRLRVRQHIITVVMDATYDITFARLDEIPVTLLAQHADCLSLFDEDYGFPVAAEHLLELRCARRRALPVTEVPAHPRDPATLMDATALRRAFHANRSSLRCVPYATYLR